jgi:hypothetical protein
MLRICKNIYKILNEIIRVKIIPEKLKRILPKYLKGKLARRLKKP